MNGLFTKLNIRFILDIPCQEQVQMRGIPDESMRHCPKMGQMCSPYVPNGRASPGPRRVPLRRPLPAVRIVF